jgi:hypothetical protein
VSARPIGRDCCARERAPIFRTLSAPMASVPTQLPAVPPYQVAPLVAQVNEPGGPFSLTAAGVPTEVSCAQAVGAS